MNILAPSRGQKCPVVNHPFIGTHNGHKPERQSLFLAAWFQFHLASLCHTHQEWKDLATSLLLFSVMPDLEMKATQPDKSVFCKPSQRQ